MPQTRNASSDEPASRHGALGRWLNRLGFRAKFLIVGLALALPLGLLAGFTAATFNREVQQDRERIAALRQSAAVRELITAMALHRGLSASVLAGAEALSSPLVAQQARLAKALETLLGSLDRGEWQGVGLADPDGLAEEVRALMRLPDAGDPRRNFERHTDVNDALLGLLRRVGLEISAGRSHRDSAAAYALVFVTLPALMEDLGRQRGWGSAVMTLEAFTPEETRDYLLYAGGGAQRLRQVQTDRRTRAALDARLAHEAEPGSLAEALNGAEAFSRASIEAVLAHRGGSEAATAHFHAGTEAIDALRGVVDHLGAALTGEAEAALQRAVVGRAASLGFLALVVLGLAALYAAFERSTVQRLRALQQSSRRLAQGEFDAAIAVDGSDEIAALGAAFDDMRRLLRGAVAERAAGLAARDTERARTEFLARWSHELRTPLAAVLGFARVLEERDDGRLSDAQRDDLRRIRGAGERLTMLVDEVLGVTAAAPPAAGPGAAPLSGRLAYVEDDELNLLLFEAMLARHPGLQVTPLRSAAEALAAAPTDFDLWVIDRHLPDGDGVALFEALRARRGDALRAVMFSADALPRRREEALAAGLLDYWVKPMTAESLQAALARWLAAPAA